MHIEKFPSQCFMAIRVFLENILSLILLSTLLQQLINEAITFEAITKYVAFSQNSTLCKIIKKHLFS